MYYVCEFIKCKYIKPFLYHKGEILILHKDVKDWLKEKGLIKVHGRVKKLKINF